MDAEARAMAQYRTLQREAAADSGPQVQVTTLAGRPGPGADR
jgi:hypothetical protein